jgi:non-lysosomal glucosylceramidase
MYPMVMTSSAILARALGNESLAALCESRAADAGRGFMAALWNGEFFSYGAELNGTGRTDDIMFSGMLAGQMLSRHAGFGDLPAVPFSAFQSSMGAQLKTHVAQSYNFFPPKVYNLSTKFSAIDRNNQHEASTWSFYLESYTAAAAMQAGFLEDGLEVVRHIGLLNLRLGLSWCQNLWNPGSVYLPRVLAQALLVLQPHPHPPTRPHPPPGSLRTLLRRSLGSFPM